MEKGFYIKTKEYKKEFYINVIVDKRVVGIESPKISSSDYIIFLFIVDYTYPEVAPKVLAKSEFCTPSLKDGRDLMSELIPNWSKDNTLVDIAKEIPKFLTRISRGYKFYGKYHLGATYDLKNFESMLISSFSCKVIDEPISNSPKATKPPLDPKADYFLMLSGDAFVLFDKKETGNGTIVFWGSLYGITDLQINKKSKNVKMTFYDDEDDNEYILQLNIENIVLFRDTLTKKMKSLHIHFQSSKIDNKQQVLRLSTKEVNRMSLTDIEKNVKDLETRINNNEITNYTIGTFSNLCGKAIEQYALMENNEKSHYYLKLMQEVLNREDVKKMEEEIEMGEEK